MPGILGSVASDTNKYKGVIGYVIHQEVKMSAKRHTSTAQSQAKPWYPSTEYTEGDRVINFGNTYVAIVPGKSGELTDAGPIGIGSDIHDGTVAWSCDSVPIESPAPAISEPEAVAESIAWSEPPHPRKK